MELTNGALDLFPELKGKRISVQTVRDRELVCSTTFLERVPPDQKKENPDERPN
jgi:hypothetical protein